MVGSKPLFIAAYYRPSESDEHSALEFKMSLDLVNQEKGNIWILGDLNYPDLTWDDDDVPIIKPGCSYPRLYDAFVEMLNDFSLSQMVREPTRDGNILDLFMTTNPTLVKSISIIPGLSDHDIVRCVIETKPKQSKQPPRKAYLYRKADWESFREYMNSFCDSFVNTVELKSIEEIWPDLKGAIEQGISNFIPTKQISGRKNLPWITQSIKREIRKRDHLYQKYKKSKNPADRRSFLNCNISML